MSIVLQLQKKCLDKNEDLQSLLREAYVISKKLKLTDFQNWVNNELKGYHQCADEDIPKYRNLHTTLKFHNPYHGLQPAIIDNPKISELLSNTKITQPLSEIEDLSTRSENDTLSLTLSDTNIVAIMKLFKTNNQPVQLVYKTQMLGIVDQVRNILLDWTLTLEDDGILGDENLFFSEEEKEAAKNILIENFHGVLGDIGKIGNVSTGINATNIYNENNINNAIDQLIDDVKKLGLVDQEKIILDLEASKSDKEKAKSVLGNLLAKGSEVSSISSGIIDILGLLI